MWLLTYLSEVFWDEDVWLPPNFTWEKLANSKEYKYPVYGDLWTYPFVIAAAFILLRYYVLNPFVLKPIGRAVGVKEKYVKPPEANAILEALMKECKGKPGVSQITGATKKLGWPQRQVERWIKRYKSSFRSSDMLKFCDCGWQVIYYSAYVVLGFFVMWDKEWLWNITHCWYGFPTQDLDNDVWWYYMISLGYYWSMTITHFFQHQQKDSLQMFIHHVVTILLLVLSWITNFIRIGTLVLIVHECVDIPMLLAKMCRHANRPHLMDPFFAVFFLLWLSTRTGLYPFWILNSTLYEAHVVLNMWYPVYFIFNGLLCFLFIIHVFWTILIIRIIINKLKTKEINDVRSDSEDCNDDDISDDTDDKGSFCENNKVNSH